ncbi:MAG: PD40 domain-containing protein [Nitrospinae bacterium]|nr:PD40 domain-containing protein [Nitrospinota bacterium]
MTNNPPGGNGIKIVFSAKDETGFSRLYLTCGDFSKFTLLEGVSGEDAITPIFTPDGMGVFFAERHEGRFNLHYYDLSAGRSIALTDDGMNDYAPAISPCGKRLAWCRSPEMTLKGANLAEIFVSDWPEFKPRRLTDNDRMDAYPVFTGNGESVIIESGNTAGLFGLFKINFDDGRETPLSYDPENYGAGIPSAFGGRIVYERCESASPGLFNIFEISLEDNGSPQNIAAWNTPCNPSPRYSPDGKLVAAHRLGDDRASSQIVIFPASGHAPLVEIGGPDERYMLPRWSRDSGVLAFVNSSELALYFLDLSNGGGRPKRIPSPGPYRMQRFMEIYNFDIY